MSIGPMLQQFVDDELSRAPALIERTLAGTLQLLRDPTDNPLTPGERVHQSAIVEALQAHGAAFQRAFARALYTGVQDALSEQQNGLPAQAPGGGGGLQLMDESRVEVDIEISRAMQLIDNTAEWERRELQTFTSTLVGLAHVSAESNPFRPLVYATALWQAASVVSPAPVHRTAILRVSAGVTAGLLKNAWAAACTRLEAQGVQPGIYRTVLLPPGAVVGRAAAPAEAAKGAVTTSLLARMPDDSANVQLGLGGSGIALNTSAARLTPTAIAAELDEALEQLEEMLRGRVGLYTTEEGSADALVKRLALHRAALLVSAGSAVERQIIELLWRVFDTILVDPNVPPGFSDVFSRLRASALRLALHDQKMFDSTEHPMWRLFDRIAQAGTGYPQTGDPRAVALLSFCHTLGEQLARTPSPDAALYRRALAQLDAFLDDQLQGQLAAAQDAMQTLQLAERREVLEQRLSQRLIDQMVPVRTTPSVRRFVTGDWARVLAEAMLRHGEQGDVTRDYIKLVDELLWSLQLPNHPQSRQRLVALLPSMLKRLRSGMEMIELPAAEQTRVLDDLMTVHTEALRPGRGDSSGLTPEGLLQRMRDEVLPASTGLGSFSDSVIDLGSIETVPTAAMGSEGGRADPAKRVESLLDGERLRLFLQGRWARVQLLWRSDQGLYFLFAGETIDHTHSISHRALARLSSAGLMESLETKPLVRRTLDRVTRELERPT